MNSKSGEIRCINSTCPHCAGSIELPLNNVGMAIKCPHCAEIFILTLRSKKINRWLVLALLGLAISVLAISFANHTLKIRKQLAAEKEAARLKDMAEIESSPGILALKKSLAKTESPKDVLDRVAEGGWQAPKEDLPDFGNGLPTGKWASTLVAVETESNLYRDPATGKKYRFLNGVIVEETNPYAGLTIQQLKIKIDMDAKIAQWKAEDRKKQLEDDQQAAYLSELRRANNIADAANFDRRIANQQQSIQNRQALDELREIRLDNQLNALKPQVIQIPAGHVLVNGVWVPYY